MTTTHPLRRSDEDRKTQSAGALELFYDLVFVFAITQVSHLLLAHLTWKGAGEAALALLVVWWSWNYTTWVTNELDPDSSLSSDSSPASASASSAVDSSRSSATTPRTAWVRVSPT